MRRCAELQAERMVARPPGAPQDQPFRPTFGMPSKPHCNTKVRNAPDQHHDLADRRSCLFHTINILTNRAKLRLSREPDSSAQMTEDNPLLQCMSSANTIIALFELYKRCFGDGHVVLSLAYSVYTAASIFLMEVQALRHAAPHTLERLSFCMGALDRLRVTSPGTAT